MLYQFWVYLTGFIFWLNGLTPVKSECYTPSYGYLTILDLLLQLSSYIIGFTFPYFLYFMPYSVGFSLVWLYMIHTGVCLSTYLLYYLSISLECWILHFSRLVLKYAFWNSWRSFSGFLWHSTLLQYLWTQTPIVWYIYMSSIWPKNTSHLGPIYFLWQVEKNNCRDASNSNFQAKCVWREINLSNVDRGV